MFTIDAPDPASSVIVNAWFPPGASVPDVQVIRPAASAHPALAETNVEFVGTGSVTVTPVAVVGPRFVAVRV
jgi:hypothetical protein